MKKNSERRKPKHFAAYELKQQTIIITGGGIVLRKENVEILRSQAVIVWLDGDEETLFARASRKQEQTIAANEKPEKDFLANPWCPQASLREHRGYSGRHVGAHG